jgi:hypothetical protein
MEKLRMLSIDWVVMVAPDSTRSPWLQGAYWRYFRSFADRMWSRQHARGGMKA